MSLRRRNYAKRCASPREEIYSREAVRRDIMGLTDAYADRGYAFADVTPTVSIDQAARVVNLSFTTRPGS